MGMRRLLAGVLLIGTAPGILPAQAKQGKNAGIDWNKPFPAHRVIGNVFSVGSEQLGSFLISTPAGHILINSDYEETIPVIRAGVEQLGFKFSDIRILLGSHAHPDHMSGDALFKELTGAKVMAMEQDVPALRNMRQGGKEHPIDRILHDGDTVELGGSVLTAHLTAGHTKGCTTWTLKVVDSGKSYDVVIVGSVSLNAAILVNNRDYPQIVDDYVRSFQTLRSLHADVFLGSHTGFYQMTQKYAKLSPGGPNPYIDPQGYQALIDSSEKAFNDRLAELKNSR
jgi:metallo-beta-lactamase class B